MRTDYAAIYQAWCRFRKGKRPSRAIDAFAYDLEANVAELATAIQDKSHRHGGYQRVVVAEKKRRDLAVATVRDRVVHRLLYDYLLEKFDAGFDPDVWSCRVGKGLHKCLARTQNLLREHHDSYVWRADVTKFFDSVDQDRLMECLRRKIDHDQVALDLCQKVIASYNVLSKQGIPIGNLTSQIFANIYLHELDRFVRHELKPQAYVRYGDDFILFCPSRQTAHRLRDNADSYLRAELGLALNPKNDVIVAAKDGLKFLGHAITSDYALVDKHTTRSILGKVDWRNVASYRSLPLVKTAKASLDWVLLENMFDKYD